MYRRQVYKKCCCICRKEYETGWGNSNVCSWECRQEKNRKASRIIMQLKRHAGNRWRPCEVCGFAITTDIHHEEKTTHILCPNHHAMITRGIKTFEEMIKDKK